MAPLDWPDQKDISTEETLPPARPWLPSPDEHQGWSTRASESPPKRPRAAGLLAAARRRRCRSHVWRTQREEAIASAPPLGFPVGGQRQPGSQRARAGRFRSAQRGGVVGGRRVGPPGG